MLGEAQRDGGEESLTVASLRGRRLLMALSKMEHGSVSGRGIEKWRRQKKKSPRDGDNNFSKRLCVFLFFFFSFQEDAMML